MQISQVNEKYPKAPRKSRSRCKNFLSREHIMVREAENSMTNATGIIDNKEMRGKWLQRAIWWLSQFKYKMISHRRLCWWTSLQLVALFGREGDSQETLGSCGLSLLGVGYWECILGVNVLLCPFPIMLRSLATGAASMVGAGGETFPSAMMVYLIIHRLCNLRAKQPWTEIF